MIHARSLVNPLLLFSHSRLSKVKAEVSTAKAEVLTGKTEVSTGCAKYRKRQGGSCYRLRETLKRQAGSSYREDGSYYRLRETPKCQA
ncbi:hypothetical protein, partial [Nostoc sp. 'Peltigera malacea cyanobiont' DB3992]|uniref:hypothetical protein n=1 Tax=Nostoc sp. 'Peltigera malacea cyanobiont' DB3992 TaxID=1206980 RepID=UPI00211ED242